MWSLEPPFSSGKFPLWSSCQSAMFDICRAFVISHFGHTSSRSSSIQPRGKHPWRNHRSRAVDPALLGIDMDEAVAKVNLALIVKGIIVMINRWIYGYIPIVQTIAPWDTLRWIQQKGLQAYFLALKGARAILLGSSEEWEKALWYIYSWATRKSWHVPAFNPANSDMIRIW